MELQEALAQISEIRTRIARTETFRGYRSATVGFSGGLAVGGSLLQAVWIPKPIENVSAFLTLWIAIAVVSLAVTGFEMIVRGRRASSPWTVRLAWMAAEQFLPCVLAGGLLTFVLVMYADETLWMLPGLWSIIFSLGVFASCRLLPRASFFVAVYYLVAGILCLAFAQGTAALSPWSMAGTFGIGQLTTAAILYFSLERKHGQQESL